MKYFAEDNRPQTKLDRDFGRGMGVTMGRLREDKLYDYKFVCLSHNVFAWSGRRRCFDRRIAESRRVFAG
jgi:aspartate-semialdehyde dehydrogenase